MASLWLVVVRGAGSPRFPRRCVVTGSMDAPLVLAPVTVDDSTRAYAIAERAELLVQAHTAAKRSGDVCIWLGTSFLGVVVGTASSSSAIGWAIAICGLMAWCYFIFATVHARHIARRAWSGPMIVTGRRVVGRSYLIFRTEELAHEVAELNGDASVTISPVGMLRAFLIVGQ